jgi:hypothetical protein
MGAGVTKKLSDKIVGENCVKKNCARDFLRKIIDSQKKRSVGHAMLTIVSKFGGGLTIAFYS